MNPPLKSIHQLRQIFLANNRKVSEVENTTGNYDDQGHLIDHPVPTITTDFWEIGAYNNLIYFTFIIQSDSYNWKLFDVFKDYPNVQFYGFNNFKTTLYPNLNFKYQEFENTIKQDKYLQIQFNYWLDQQTVKPESLYKNYLEICDKILESQVKVVDQLSVDLRLEINL